MITQPPPYSTKNIFDRVVVGARAPPGASATVGIMADARSYKEGKSAHVGLLTAFC